MHRVPAELYLLHQHFVVEESLSVIRHDLRNKMGSVRNAAFYVRRKLDKVAPDVGTKDPRIPEFLGLIVTELDAAEVILTSRLPLAEQLDTVSTGAVLHRVAELAAASNTPLEVESRPVSQVRISTDEAALAIFCFVHNAVDAGATTIRVRAVEQDGHATFEVDDDGAGFADGSQARAFEPYFTTRPGRMGFGLNIAKRVANRWKGKVELTPRERGVRASLVLKVEG